MCSAARGSPPPGTRAIEDVDTGLPALRCLTVFERDPASGLRQVAETETCHEPQALDVARSGGWLSFFDVTRDDGGVELRLTGRRAGLPRGAHDLVVID